MTSSIFAGQIGNPPTSDTVEITLLGPGFGESIVLHLPGFGWGVIDSCVFKGSSLPLHYLKALNIDHLGFVFLSHPHQDHYQGLDELLAAFPSVDLVGRYNGNSIEELKRFWLRQDHAKGTDITDSLSKVFNALKQAADRGARYRKLSEMVVMEKSGETNAGPYITKIVVLSPSAVSEDKYAEALQRCIPRIGKPMRTLKSSDRNLIASAIWIGINDMAILLGSDVEKGTHSQTGWKGIVSIPGCPKLEIDAIKVAHHGSSSSHHQAAWSRHKLGNPISMITPFVNGRLSFPGIGDVQRVKEHSSQVGVTGEIVFDDPSAHYDRSMIHQAVYDFRNWKIIREPERAGLLRLRYNLEGKLIEQFALPPSQWF